MQRLAKHTTRVLCLAAALIGPVTLASTSPATKLPQLSPAAIERFEKNVRPLLAEACYSCHSAKLSSPMGGLRLDTRAALLKGGARGPVLIPGKPDQSLLVKALRHAPGAPAMPPDRKLTDQQIVDVKQWIAEGAPWPETKPQAADPKQHWAFRPLKVPAVPTVRNKAWVKNPVDAFILARLEAKGLRPTPPADRPTLIRRVTFDLTGLPPTPEEVAAFINDKSPDAWAKVVDRLLSSPHYGERWARHWLDLVRYAESRGHEFDPLIPNAWQYRDYVIRAFNADVPYDRFVTEHLAGDLLEEPRLHPRLGFNESILGTGFWFLGEEVHSPVDTRQDETDRLDNRLDTMAKAFTGLTLGCARCHDHKFDPISQQDYYGLAGFLLSATYRQTPFETQQHNRRIAEQLDQLQREAAPVLLKAHAQAMRLVAKMPLELATAPEAPKHARVILDYGTPGADAWMADGLTFGSRPVKPGEIILGTPAQPIRELISYHAARRNEAWNSFHAASGTESDYGDLGKWDRPGRVVRTPKVVLESGKLRYLVRGSGRAYASVDSHLLVNGPLHGRTLLEWEGEPDRWQWVTQDLGVYRGHRVEVEFSPKTEEGPLAIAKVIESDTDPGPPQSQPSSPETLSRVLAAMEKGRIDDPELARMGDWMIRHTEISSQAREKLAPAAAPFLKRRDELVRQIRLESQVAPAMFEGNGVDEAVLRRGSYQTPGDPAPRRYFGVLAGENQPPIQHGSGRLELARRMLAHPLTARVIVNRVWQHHFGEGLVHTPDDFGTRGEPPTNPELLEWLTAAFTRAPASSSGSTGKKPSLRARSYQREAIALDQEVGSGDRTLPLSRPGGGGRGEGFSWSLKSLHRLILLSNTYQQARPPRRLEAEAIRDSMLAVSGRLDRKQFGPPVLPYLTELVQGRGRPESGPLDGDGRRTIYLGVRRNFLSPFLLAFDYPVPFATVGKRSVSTVPAQALALLNNPFVLQQAEVWAKRTLSQTASRPDRIDRLYLEAFARRPSPDERTAALDFVEKEDQRYGATDDLRSWTDLCHVLFNTKEFIFLN